MSRDDDERRRGFSSYLAPSSFLPSFRPSLGVEFSVNLTEQHSFYKGDRHFWNVLQFEPDNFEGLDRPSSSTP